MVDHLTQMDQHISTAFLAALPINRGKSVHKSNSTIVA